MDIVTRQPFIFNASENIHHGYWMDIMDIL
jgi:hypothetical protein